MYTTIGFAVACGLCAYVEDTIAKVLCCAASVLLFSVIGRDSRPISKAAVILLGCVAGFLWYQTYDAHYLQTTVSLDGKTLPAVIRAADYSEETDYGVVFEGTVVLEGKTYRVRTWLEEKTSVTPGTQLAGQFCFRSTVASGREEYTNQQGQGIFLLAYQKETVTRVSKEQNWWERALTLRQEITALLQTFFPEDTVSFAKALLLGDTSDLSYAVDTDLKISGIRHVVAVSGLHISILFTLVSTVTLHRRFLTALLGFPTLFLFALITGLTPSVTRACIMCALMLLAMLLDQEYDGPTALSFAVLVMLIANPLVITSVSFQLSVTSVMGIFLFQPRIHQWLQGLLGEIKGKNIRARLLRWFSSSVSVTLSAISLTTPLCAYYFGVVSLIGVVTNLLTLWVISFIFYGIVFVCLLHFVLPASAAFLAKWIAYPIRFIQITARFLARLPLSAVYTASPFITAWLVFVYILLLLFLSSDSKEPLVLFCSMVLGLCFSLFGSWAESRQDDIRFTVLDVGQGQCLLLQTEGKAYMVDCGGDSDTVTADIAAEALLSQGITKLDGMILTHLDRDHAGAAANFLSRIETELLILPPVHSDLAEYTNAQTIYAQQDLCLTLETGVIQIYVPVFYGTSNENSLCVLFDTEKCDILITGDRDTFGERMLLRNAEIPDVDILVAGHHGSKNSTGEDLLAAVQPEIVCISVGEDNSYGHPAEELLERLDQFGCSVYRTDIHGTITIRR